MGDFFNYVPMGTESGSVGTSSVAGLREQLCYSLASFQ